MTLTFRSILWACSLAVLLPAWAEAVQTPASADYVFRAPAGLLIFHVRVEGAADFETVMNRLDHGLAATTDAVRRAQRVSWRLFRATESATGSAVYVLVIDPAVTDADYDPVRMLAEVAPGESPDLYARLKASVTRVERLNLTPVRPREQAPGVPSAN
jgi:hypothetical protein